MIAQTFAVMLSLCFAVSITVEAKCIDVGTQPSLLKKQWEFSAWHLCALRNQEHIVHGPAYIMEHEKKPVTGQAGQIRIG